MFWPKKEKKFEEESQTISLIQGVPEGFFRCHNCKKVLPTTKFGSTVWAGKGAGYLCKNCFSVGESKPKVPEHLMAKLGEKPRSVKRY